MFLQFIRSICLLLQKKKFCLSLSNVILNMTKTSVPKKDSAYPWIITDDIPQWTILFEAHLGAEKVLFAMKKGKPRFSQSRYDRIRRRDGRGEAEHYRRSVRRKAKRWVDADATCYDVLVKSCTYCPEAQTVWMDNAGVTAAELKKKLDERFTPTDVNAVINYNLGVFNTMELLPTENGTGYADRIIRGSLKMQSLGHPMKRDTSCLERLINGMAFDPRYEKLSATLEGIPNLTWDKALNMVTAFDSRVRRRAGQSSTPSSGTKSATMTALSLDPKEVEQLKRMLVKKKGVKRDRETVTSSTPQKQFTGECYVCGKKGHQAKQCRKRHKGSTAAPAPTTQQASS